MDISKLYLGIATWINDEDESHTGGYPYFIEADSYDEAMDKFEAILVQEEIGLDPDGHDDYPVTWESLDYENDNNDGRGFQIYLELLTDSINENKVQ